MERRRRRRGGGLAALLLSAAVLIGILVWLGRRRSRVSDEWRFGMTDANKRTARRILEELFGEGRMETADELVAPGAVGHDPALPEPTRGPEGVKRSASVYRAGFPDLRIRIEDQCAEGDLVTTRWTAIGTNTGELWGMPASGKQATVTGITIDRIIADRVVESWTNWDALGLMQQLGVIPTAAHA